jgi:hypothetical protein
MFKEVLNLEMRRLSHIVSSSEEGKNKRSLKSSREAFLPAFKGVG